MSAKLVLHLDGEPVQFDGSVEEIVEFIKILRREKVPFTTDDEERRRIQSLAEERNAVVHARQNLPSVAQVKDYILSQPDYAHSTFDIQKHFFGREFKARGITEGLFHEFLKLATEARSSIEKEKDGHFEFELKLGRHKIYRWVQAGQQ